MTKHHQKLWQPSSEFLLSSNMQQYQLWLSANKGLDFHNHHHIWQWSIENISDFWESIWQYHKVIDHGSYESVLANEQMPGSDWFCGSMINYAEHVFRNRTVDHPALIFQNETSCDRMSWSILEDKVYAIQQFLISNDIKKGDRVAGFIPNIPDAIICFLAANSIGAVWSCCSPDFGVETVVDRFSQIEPKLLFAVDGYQYNTKHYDKLEATEYIRNNISSIETLVLIPYLDSDAKLPNSVNINDIYKSDRGDKQLTFTPVEFSHPIWVLYSSGTTGKPKAITHSHGGVLLEHLKYLSLHNDVKRGENFFWFSTTGWMMWNFLQANMLLGAVPVLYDGSPGYPTLDTLWQMTEELPIHHFGTSAPFLAACMKAELKVSDKYDMSHLRSIGSTGSPLAPEVFDYIYKHISEDVWLCSMSGGTDVCTAFVGGHPYKPVHKGLIQSRALGCALKSYNGNGEEMIGELGEMVIEKPMPSMPIYFWNDEKNIRYHNSYFADYPGKWRHGDWIKIFDDGSLIIQGRSDSTLNRKGVRIGTAEIYNVLDKISEIKDAVIINIEQKDGSDVMPLFIVMADGNPLSETVKTKIKRELKSQCSPRHVPDHIYEVGDIPYTLSGKKMEVPIKKIFMKMDMSQSMNRDAIKNPEAIDAFVELSKTLDLSQI